MTVALLLLNLFAGVVNLIFAAGGDTSSLVVGALNVLGVGYLLGALVSE